jgi:hypothetical protein
VTPAQGRRSVKDMAAALKLAQPPQPKSTAQTPETAAFFSPAAQPIRAEPNVSPDPSVSPKEGFVRRWPPQKAKALKPEPEATQPKPVEPEPVTPAPDEATEADVQRAVVSLRAKVMLPAIIPPPAPPSADWEDVLAEMNKRHAIIDNYGGKAVIAGREPSPRDLTRLMTVFQSKVRIPTKSAGDSERRRPPVPIEAGRGFR